MRSLLPLIQGRANVSMLNWLWEITTEHAVYYLFMDLVLCWEFILINLPVYYTKPTKINIFRCIKSYKCQHHWSNFQCSVYAHRLNLITCSICIIPAQTAEGMCSFLSPSVLQWEAMTTFVDCTVWQILKSVEEEVIAVCGSRWKILDHCL